MLKISDWGIKIRVTFAVKGGAVDWKLNKKRGSESSMESKLVGRKSRELEDRTGDGKIKTDTYMDKTGRSSPVAIWLT